MKKFYTLSIMLICCCLSFAQTPVPMASQPGLSYTENFSDIANWTNGFASGAGANRFSSVAVNTTGVIPSGTRITTATTSFASGTSGGVQRGAGSILLLSTGSTDNTSSTAIDFLMDFTGVNAGTLSFDFETVFNSTGNRNGSLRVYYSTDGTSFTELTAAQVLNFTNNVAASGSRDHIALPADFNNSPTARLRFYYHNGTGGTTGSRPKISIDNLTVTALPAGNTISVSGGTNAAEGGSTGSFVIQFSAPTSSSTDVNFDFTGAAGFGSDYTVSFSVGSISSTTASGTLTVPAGSSSVTVTVTPVDDAIVEPTENIVLSLSAPAAGYSIATGTATIDLTDNDAAPTVSVAAGTNAAEPSTDGSFLISLSAPAPPGGVTVNYSFSGTATAADYTDALTGSITIAEGNTSGTVTLAVTDDVLVEGTETITIQLNSATASYIIATGAATIDIADNDTAPLSFTGLYSQDFNSLANSGTGNGWANNSTIAGWYATRSSYNASDGSSNAGALYSFGTVSSSERALGTIGSGSTGTIYYGLRVVNHTGAPITSLKITYTGEQWRNGGNASAQTVNFGYRTGHALTSLTSGSWSTVSNLNFTSPVTGTSATALNGNLAANSTLVTYTITGLNIAVGEEILIRWEDADHGGSDHGLAIDDLTVEANPADNTPPAVTSFSPANGATQVSMNFTAAISFNEAIQKGSGNIVVKKASDNSVVQTIPVNAAGVNVSGNSASFPLSLSSNTAYYIEIDNGAFEDLAGNDFGISGHAGWAFTTGTIFYNADFTTCTSGLSDGFTQYSLTGAITWGCTTFGRDPANPAGSAPFPSGVQINGFAGGTNVPNVDWLISPAFDLTGTTYPLLSFWSRTAFNGAPLQLKISTDYTGGDPTLATWTDLNGKFPAQASNVWTLSPQINLAAFKQPNVHIAFVYTSTHDDGARWTLDDLQIENSDTPPPPSLTVSTGDMLFSFVASGSTADKTFSFTGNDITGGVTLTTSPNFLLSKDGSSFSTTISFTQAEANNIPKTVHVRFAPNQNGIDYTGTITIETSSLSETVQLRGSSIDPATTLEVVNWNIEWFGSSTEDPANDNQQEQNVKTILQHIGADIYGLIEVVDESRLASVVSQLPGYAYVISDFGSHTNTTANPPGALAQAQKLAFVYKTSVFSNVSTEALLTQGINSAADLTNPAYNYFSSGRFPYMFTADVTLNCITKKVRFVLVHAKANTSPTATSYDRRKRGADTLYQTLNQLYPDDHIVILGDLNDDLDQSITAGFTTTSWSAFTSDATNYSALTLPLSLAGKKSTVSHNDVIDHVIVSNEMNDYYMNATANILTDVSGLVSNYGSTTSDHYPVFTRYRFGNPTTAPTIVNCPEVSPVCAMTATHIDIPVFEATAFCGQVSYSYTITGNTERSGTTNNASGLFNPGTSTITWTATDAFGNSSTCQTTVVVNSGPSVMIPDVMAMPNGVLPNTVYLGYQPAASVTLQPVVTGGPVSYSWSTGASGASITVSPTVATTYTVTVSDDNGCVTSASKLINVINARGIKHSNKVLVCHNGNTIEVSANAVPAHTGHGDLLGTCTIPVPPAELMVTAWPNPSSGAFVLTIQNKADNQIAVMKVFNTSGHVVAQYHGLNVNESFTIGEQYRPGMYFVEVMQGSERKTIRLIKLK